MGFEHVESAALLLGSSQTPEVLLRTFVTYSSDDAGADEAVLYTIDEGADALVPTVTIGMPAASEGASEPMPLGEGASGRAALRKGPVVIADADDADDGVSDRHRGFLGRLGARASFATPVLASDGRVLGALEHHFRHPHRPSDVDLYRSTMYARLVAAVIEHVHFRDQDDVREALAHRRRSEIAAVAGELLGSCIDWQTTLENVARVGLPTLADLCIVSVSEEDGPLARVAAAHVDDKRQNELQRLIHGTPPSALERSVLEKRRGELRSGLRPHDSVDRALVEEFGVNSVLVLPLVSAGRSMGVITFCAAESKRQYGHEDSIIGEAIAARAAQAIDHALLHRRMQRAVRTRDELLAIASHDLKNLVSIMKLNSSYLIQTAPPFDRRGSRKQIESISRVADRMSDLVRDLLDSASIESGKLAISPSRQQVRALLADACGAMQPLADDHGLRLDVELPPEELEVICDPSRIHQVLTNLVGNALKFMSKGAVHVRAERRGRAVHFEVRDEGVGIASEDIAQVFDRFWRGRGRGNLGVGLGLYIAKSIIDAHGGTMSVESARGSGSTFRFTLPVA